MYEVTKILVDIAFVAIVAYTIYKAVKKKKDNEKRTSKAQNPHRLFSGGADFILL